MEKDLGIGTSDSWLDDLAIVSQKAQYKLCMTKGVHCTARRGCECIPFSDRRQAS